MKLREFVQWLQSLENQDVVVQVIKHSRGYGYHNVDGSIDIVSLYTDHHVTYDSHTLLLGEIYA